MTNFYRKFVMILFIVGFVLGASGSDVPVQADTNPHKASAADVKNSKNYSK